MSNGSCLVWDYFGISSQNTKKPFMQPPPTRLLKLNNKWYCSCQKETKKPGSKKIKYKECIWSASLFLFLLHFTNTSVETPTFKTSNCNLSEERICLFFFVKFPFLCEVLMITQYVEIRQWHLEVQLTRVCWIQTGSATMRTQSASLLNQSCQLHQRGFPASFLFWWERLWLWPGKVNSTVPVGDFSLIITGLSTYSYLSCGSLRSMKKRIN